MINNALRINVKKIPCTIAIVHGIFLSDWFVMTRGPQRSREAGRRGIAPACVQTNADVSTARLWAFFTLLPLRMFARKAAVNESPAPTVSSTSTTGVGWNETLPGVKT